MFILNPTSSFLMTLVVYALENRYEERNENFLDLINYTDPMSDFEDK